MYNRLTVLKSLKKSKNQNPNFPSTKIPTFPTFQIHIMHIQTRTGKTHKHETWLVALLRVCPRRRLIMVTASLVLSFPYFQTQNFMKTRKKYIPARSKYLSGVQTQGKLKSMWDRQMKVVGLDSRKREGIEMQECQQWDRTKSRGPLWLCIYAIRPDSQWSQQLRDLKMHCRFAVDLAIPCIYARVRIAFIPPTPFPYILS